MKKLISVFLAALMLLGTFSVIALADEGEGFVPVYTVRVAANTEGKVDIVNVEDPTTNTVNAGRPFFFTLKYRKGYTPDGTVVVKVYPASYPAELVCTDKDVTSETLTPDENGVYCISQVNEDYYVEVLNVTETQFSSLKDMLISFYNAILNLFKKLFNL
jgi:hypothetical protein